MVGSICTAWRTMDLHRREQQFNACHFGHKFGRPGWSRHYILDCWFICCNQTWWLWFIALSTSKDNLITKVVGQWNVSSHSSLTITKLHAKIQVTDWVRVSWWFSMQLEINTGDDGRPVKLSCGDEELVITTNTWVLTALRFGIEYCKISNHWTVTKLYERVYHTSTHLHVLTCTYFYFHPTLSEQLHPLRYY